MNVRVGLSWFLAVLSLLCFSRVAFAHKPGLSRLDGRTKSGDVLFDVTFARDELLALDRSLDADKSGTLDDRELAAAIDPLKRSVVDHVVVVRGEKPCAGAITSVTNEENDGVTLHTRYVCEDNTSTKYRVTFALFDELSSGHRCFLTFTSGNGVSESILSRDHASEDLVVSASTATTAEPPRSLGNFGSIVLLGIEHILTGWDHLLFLFGLVLVGGKWRSTLAVITAFTIAHSITLAVAALGIFTPSPRIIEPAIALSIAYVGAENFVVSDVAKRWRITFPFGLIHGFGFAGALAEIHIPKERIPATLLGFNLGVEVGQIGVLLIVVPLLTFLRKREWFRTKGVRALSAVIVVVGVALFFQRAIQG